MASSPLMSVSAAGRRLLAQLAERYSGTSIVKCHQFLAAELVS